MKLNKAQLAKEINHLAAIKARKARLEIEEAKSANLVRKAGGGESDSWRAALIVVPEKTMVVKKHKQLRLFKLR